MRGEASGAGEHLQQARIRKSKLQNGLLVEQYFLPAASFMLDNENQELQDAKQIYDFICSQEGKVKQMTITYAMKGTKLNAKRIEAALKALTEAGMVDKNVYPTEGRPVTMYSAVRKPFQANS